MSQLRSVLACVVVFVLAVPAYALDQCAEGQQPYKIIGIDAAGPTPAAACAAMVGYEFSGGTWTSAVMGGPYGPGCHAGGHPGPSANGYWEEPQHVCEATEEPTDEWYLSIPKLLQLLLVCCVMFSFQAGYRSGDKI